ncbi:MAG: peptidyl-alpha-hydroxyglycine alpha-amidating lyase family protein [Chloroflexota bacterium]
MAKSLDFDANDRWERLPGGVSHKDLSAVGVDSRDRVYVASRFPDQVLVFERDGTFVTAWGGEHLRRTHGLTVGPDDSIYVVDNGLHVVRKFAPDGTLLMTIGTPGQVTDTGYNRQGPFEIHHNETVVRSAGPFNECTNLAIAPNGDLYVSDGYGNARVHQFSENGALVRSWGEPGTAPGQFHLPHGIWVTTDGRVVVADRENDRLQLFDLAGNLLDVWTDVQRPTAVTTDRDGRIYVAELWRPQEKGQGSFTHGYASVDLPGRVSVYEPDGKLTARWGASIEHRTDRGNFIAPHGICVDRHGDVYVTEVTYTFGVKAGRIPEERGWRQIQKFARRG